MELTLKSDNQIKRIGLPRRKRRAGFTLIELLIAMAIVSVSFVGMLGMMCSGLYLFHQGMNLTTSSEIAQQVINSVQQTGYSQLSQLQSQTYYFDDQGNQLSVASQAQAVFEAYITVNSTVQLPGAVSNSLATVSIQIAFNPGRLTINWGGSTPGVSIENFITTIANAS